MLCRNNFFIHKVQVKLHRTSLLRRIDQNEHKDGYSEDLKYQSKINLKEQGIKSLREVFQDANFNA